MAKLLRQAGYAESTAQRGLLLSFSMPESVHEVLGPEQVVHTLYHPVLGCSRIDGLCSLASACLSNYWAVSLQWRWVLR